MNLEALVSHLIESIVTDPDMIAVKQFDEVDDVITIQVLVSKADIGRVIGKDGATIGAIRNLVRSCSAYHNSLPVNVVIDTF